MEFLIFILLLLSIMSGSIAYSKNRNWFGWALLGLLIGIFSVIWIACLPSLEE